MYKTRNILYNLDMEKEIPISEVRERLLSLVDDLPRDGVIITRHGNPIARLMPVRTATADLIGSLKGIITDPDDDLFSTGEQWDAQSWHAHPPSCHCRLAHPARDAPPERRCGLGDLGDCALGNRKALREGPDPVWFGHGGVGESSGSSARMAHLSPGARCAS